MNYSQMRCPVCDHQAFQAYAAPDSIWLQTKSQPPDVDLGVLKLTGRGISVTPIRCRICGYLLLFDPPNAAE
jgi:DNA-directed RNA polymerase subunit RPC12/RpoP